MLRRRRNIFRQRKRWVQLDRSKIRNPNKRRKVIRQNVIYVTLGCPRTTKWAAVFTQSGRCLVAFFLKEKFFVHASGIALQSKWVILEMRQQHGRNAHIIIDHLSFGEPGGRIGLYPGRSKPGACLRSQLPMVCQPYQFEL